MRRGELDRPNASRLGRALADELKVLEGGWATACAEAIDSTRIDVVHAKVASRADASKLKADVQG